MRYLLAITFLTIASSIAACAAEAEEEPTASAEGAAKVCAKPRIPNELNDLKALDACQLKALFESDEAKNNTADERALAKGAYDGIPLSRKEIVPLDLPPALNWAQPLMLTMKISDRLENAFASKLWHGKEFTVAEGATRGTVLNFIDMHTDGIEAETKKAAEAVHFVDPEKKWMVLDYTGAATGLGGFLIDKMSVKIIEHVYDTARIVNPEKQIYLGMAWLVQTPGKFEPNSKNSVATCYFALQPHK